MRTSFPTGVSGIRGSHAAGGKSGAHFRAVQIREQGIPRRPHADSRERTGDRRRRIYRYGGTGVGAKGKKNKRRPGNGRVSTSKKFGTRRRAGAKTPTTLLGGGGRGT